MSIEVDRIDAGSPAALPERLFGRDTPVTISGGVDESVREKFWSLSALRSLACDAPVSVTKSETEIFGFTDDGEPLYTKISLPFAEALSLILNACPPGPFYYIRQAALSDLGIPTEGLPGASIQRDKKTTLNLWVSTAGCVTLLHYDAKSNLLTQMQGTKEIILFPPSEHRLMYPYAMHRTTFLHSRVNPEAVDEKLFPGFPSHKRFMIELKAGDSLFIPPFWWHQVRSLDLSVSTSVLRRVRPGDCLVEAAVDYLRLRYQTQWLSEFFEHEGPRAPFCFARLAVEAQERGLACAATLFCAVAARLTLQQQSLALDETSPARSSAFGAEEEKLTTRAVAARALCIFRQPRRQTRQSPVIFLA
jgi:hypothetical protein